MSGSPKDKVKVQESPDLKSHCVKSYLPSLSYLKLWEYCSHDYHCTDPHRYGGGRFQDNTGENIEDLNIIINELKSQFEYLKMEFKLKLFMKLQHNLEIPCKLQLCSNICNIMHNYSKLSDIFCLRRPKNKDYIIFGFSF